MRIALIPFLIALSLLGWRGARAELLKIDQLDHAAWTARDGAPTEIIDLAMDPDGSLWVLSGTGLYDFDGLHFAPFSLPPSSKGISWAALGAMTVSRDGCLWLGSSTGGIARICRHQIRQVYDESSGLPNGEVTQIFESPDGEMMAITGSRLMIMRDGRWQNVIRSSPLKSQPIRRAFFDRQGRLLLMTPTAVWYRSSGKGQREFLKTSAPGGFWGRFAEQPDGTLWLLANSRGAKPAVIQRVYLDSLLHAHPEKVEIQASEIAADPNGSIWIAADAGLARFMPSALIEAARGGHAGHTSGLLDMYTHLDGLTSGTVNVVLHDASGNLWVTTDAGLNRFRRPRLVRVLGPEPRDPTLTMCPSGDLWVGALYQSLVRITRDQSVSARGLKRNPDAIHCDRSGVVWLMAEEGFWRYAGDSVQQVRLPAGIDPIALRAMVGEDSRRLYISISQRGLWSYEDGRWGQVSAPGFPRMTPFSLFEDRSGRVWAGYPDNRIAVLEGGVGRVYAAGDAAPLGAVQVFLESQAGLIAGGTYGLAIFRGGHFQSLLAADPKSVAGISGLLEASNGDLWLNALHGIVRIPKEELQAAIASPAHRMGSELLDDAGISGPSSQIWGLPSAVADQTGRLWFATSMSLVSVDPAFVELNGELPKLGRFSMTVDGEPIPANREVAPGAHTIRIDYLGILLSAPGRVIYQYRLEGFDKTWQDVGTRSEAVYTGLRPGGYTFLVRASSGGGRWTPADASQRFVVLRPFYQTAWFLCVAIALGIFIAWMLARLRLMQIAAAIRRQATARADERIRIARDLHDTLLQGVQGLTLRFHAAAQEVKSDARAHGHLVDALKSADTLLIEARDRVSGLREHDLENIDLAEAYQKIGGSHNYENLVAFSVKVEGPVASLPSSVSQELYFLGREAITNAFRHANASSISVLIRYARSSLDIAFRDDGCGFHNVPAGGGGQPRHWGIAGMMERAHRIGARFDCCTQPGAGTTIVVSVPLPHSRIWSRLAGLFRFR